jgi:predicted ATP-dependent Lon-type protease
MNISEMFQKPLSRSINGVVKADQDDDVQVAFDAGAKRVALPMNNAADIATIPPELFTKFQVSFYGDPVDGVFKALGVD